MLGLNYQTGTQAAGYANTQINHVSHNCVDGNLYHGQTSLSVNYFDESEALMPGVPFHSTEEMEATGPACLRSVVLPWRQVLPLRGHLIMSGNVFLVVTTARGGRGVVPGIKREKRGMQPNTL